MKSSLFHAPLLAGLLAGCAVPAIDPSTTLALPPAWQAQGGALQLSSRWWTGFGDPVLDALVDEALQHNLDLLQAAAKLDEAQALMAAQGGSAWPQVAATEGGNRSKQVSDVTLKPYFSGNQEFEVAASYEVDLWGRVRDLSKAAHANEDAIRQARDTVALAIAANVASGYVTLRALDARLATALATLDARADALRIARRRAETGYTSMLELRQAEGEYKATEQLVPQARLAVTRQENALGLLLGEPPRAIGRGLKLADLATPAVPDGLPADLLRRRPDIYQGEQALVAADRTLDSARAAFLPSVRLTGSAGLVLSSLLPDPITIWSVGGSVLAPLFDAGRIRAQADTAAARRDQAAFGYRRTVLTAFREVEDSQAAVIRTGEQVIALSAQVDALRQGLRVATNRYRAGYSPYLDQLDAQRQLLTAELTLIQARADRLTALVALYQAMGGGWRGIDATTP